MGTSPTTFKLALLASWTSHEEGLQRSVILCLSGEVAEIMLTTLPESRKERMCFLHITVTQTFGLRDLPEPLWLGG